MKRDEKLKIKFTEKFGIEVLNPGKNAIVITAMCLIFLLVLVVLCKTL